MGVAHARGPGKRRFHDDDNVEGADEVADIAGTAAYISTCAAWNSIVTVRNQGSLPFTRTMATGGCCRGPDEAEGGIAAAR